MTECTVSCILYTQCNLARNWNARSGRIAFLPTAFSGLLQLIVRMSATDLPKSIRTGTTGTKPRLARPRLPRLDQAPDLVEQVYNALVIAISAGTLGPGDRITQEDLAEQFQVSRQPVLQALRILKRDGLLHDAPGRGVVVAPLEPQTIRWVYQLRGALDELAVALAAAHCARIDPAIVRNGRRALARRDLALLIDADLAFHRAIYEASANPLILQAAESHWCQIRRAMGGYLDVQDAASAVWDEHAAIAEAVAGGRVDQARRLSQAHTQRASEVLVARLLQPSRHDLETHVR